jgi:glyoxylase-like metal-dependent hydrolase (beta-lactamase superfamily II)
VPMSAGGLLVERDGRRLLIDAGLGAIAGANEAGAADSGSLLDSLAALGHQPADVDTLALTHLHEDHTGWAFAGADAGGFRKVFADARYVLAAAEWTPRRGDGSHFAAMFGSIEDELVLVEDGAEIFPGVRALVTPGHSPGHTSYVVTGALGRVVVFGDAFHNPVQLARPDWGSGPDWNGPAVPAARRRVIEELDQTDTYGFAFHFGDQPFGRVGRNDVGAATWQPVPSDELFPTPRRLS